MFGSRVKPLLASILLLGVLTAVLLGAGLMLVLGTGLAGSQPPPPAFPDIPSDRPLTILVRGWLWDPSSRRVTAPLVEFPRAVNDILQQEHGIATAYHQFDWTRVPRDIFGATDRFTDYARKVTEAARRKGTCVNFVGHSGGAMMIYWAAAEGVPMGYMGTLGLPTVGARKPSSVAVWTNFYTDNHIDDIAGWMWGRHIGSDANFNLKIPHRDFWGAEEVHRASAGGIARAWAVCGPGRANQAPTWVI